MGNSGSMHDIDIEPLTDYSHNFHCNNNNKISLSSSSNNHNSLQWTQSHPINKGKTTALIRSSFVSNDSSLDNDSLSNNKRKQYYHDISQSPSSKTSHFKVLPDLNDGPQLRNTTNGAIIQSGGTISGRKQNFSTSQQPQSLPPPTSLLQRSKTSIVYDLSSLRYNRTAIKSITPTRTLDNGSNHILESNNNQLDMNRNHHHYHHHDNFVKQKNFEKMSFKCEQSFGPMHYDHQHQNKQHNGTIENDCNYNVVHVQKTISKAEKIKNKKRKAPDPPNKNSNENGNCVTNQNLNDRKSRQEPIILAKEIHEKKNRLFKTKIESKKQLISENLDAEISDFRYDSNFMSSLAKENENLPKNSLCSTKSSSTDANEFESKIYAKDNLVERNSPFPIRREKSFDITLLTQHKNRNNNEHSSSDHHYDDNIRLNLCENSLNNNKSSQFIGSVNDLSNVSQQQQQQQQHQRFSKHKKPSLSSHNIDKNITTKKQISQLNCDFKKELEIVTKRRSITLEYMGKKLRKDLKQQQEIGKENFFPQQEQEKHRTEKNISNKNEKHPILPFLKKQNVETKIPKLKKTFYFGMESKTNSLGTLLNDRSDMERSKHSKLQQQQQKQHNDSELKLKSFESYQLIDETLVNNNHKDLNNIDAKGSNVSNDDDDDSDEDNSQNYKITEITSSKTITKNEKISLDNNDNDIQVHVRPTLPRRQLEVPQFSPTAAWKMLNDKQNRFSVSSNTDNTDSCIDFLPLTSSDIKQHYLGEQEEQIQQDYHEPITTIYPNYRNHDDRIDGTKKQINTSNISTNKLNSAYNCNDLPKTVAAKSIRTTTNSIKIEPFLIPWTPQQDLEDETSSEDEVDSNKSDINQYMNYNHLFSLSLPRGNYVSTGYNSSNRYSGSDKNHKNEIYEEKQGRNNLLKLKKRLSEALTNIGAIQSSSSSSSATKITSMDQNNTTNLYNNDDNWLLSRSVTNSVSNSLSKNLNNNSRQNGSHHKIISENDHLKQQSTFQSSSLNYLTNNSGKHIMYLPQNQNQNNQKICVIKNTNKQIDNDNY